MANEIQIGNELFVQNSAYVRLWGTQYVDDGASHCDIYLNRYTTAGVFAETVVTYDGGTGNIAITGDVTITGTLTATTIGSTEAEVSYRTVANGGAVDIGRLDAEGSSRSQLDHRHEVDHHRHGRRHARRPWPEVQIFLTACTGSSYTLALSTGTLTFNAALECAKIVRTSLGWNVVSLNGATIV
jgi:hypothetical protein